MKQFYAITAAILFCGTVAAQNRVIDFREAHNGKDLTMEEAIFKGVGYARTAAQWLDTENFVVYKDGQWYQGSVQTPALEPFKPENQDQEKPKFDILQEKYSLYGIKDGEQFPIGLSESADIVYGGTAMRNEFGFTQGFEWSPSHIKLAYYRKDQSHVTDFPVLNIQTRTGELELIKYPMNGMDSELLEIGIYDFEKDGTVWLNVNDFSEERYITNLAWSPDEKYIYAQVVDRSQHHMRLNQYKVADGSYVRTILTEDNDAWIEPLDPIRFLKGRTDVFIYRTDNRDGFRNLYLADTLGTIRRLTAVDADVTYLGNDGTEVFYTSAEVSPAQNHLFKVAVKLPRKDAVKKAKIGKPQQLTEGRGWHTVDLNENCKWFLDKRSNVHTPAVVSLNSTDGKKHIELHSVADPLEGYASCKVEFGTVPSADGQFQNYYRLIYPKDFDPAKKYPLIVYVYGGPHSQMVQDTWLGQIRMWEMLMAQKGYMVYVQDNRGTENRGAAFEKAINRRCGQAEMEDQMVGINWLKSLPYVDSERVGIHGWSYGGFMTISLMTTYPDVFKVGVAGGPVIDWKWYEIMYGERYMDTPATNPEGFQATSLINKADKLKGKLLICQGAVDDTVVWQHSLSFIQQCIDLGIPVDYFPYPIAKHNVFGRNRIHLMDKVTQYFEDYL